MDINKNLENLNNLKQSLAKLDEKYKEIRAEMPNDDKYNKIMDYFQYAISNMRNYMHSAMDDFYKVISTHLENHPPHPKTPTQMKAYLKSCGMDGDCEVEKHKVYMRASRHGPQFEATLNIKKP